MPRWLLLALGWAGIAIAPLDPYTASFFVASQRSLRTSVSVHLARWTLTEVLNDLWLATKNDAVYGSSGAIAIPAHPSAKSNHLGIELDLIAEYKQNQHVSYGFGLAHLFTGRFLNEATRGKDYNYPFAY